MQPPCFSARDKTNERWVKRNPVATRVGFEPTGAYAPSVFKTETLNRSDTSSYIRIVSRIFQICNTKFRNLLFYSIIRRYLCQRKQKP